MHELHHLVLLHNLRHVGLVALFCLVGRRQGGEILAEQRTKLRHIDLADEDGFEVARIAETLTIDFEDAVVIRFFAISTVTGAIRTLWSYRVAERESL